MPAVWAALTLVTSTWEVSAGPRVVGCTALSGQSGTGGLGPSPLFFFLTLLAEARLQQRGLHIY